MRIGELALSSVTPTETIRVHEREGRLPAAARTVGTSRMYLPEHAQRPASIGRCRSQDMTLDDVR